MATKRVLYTLLLIVILGVGLTAYVDLRTPPPHPTVAEAAIEPGDVVETVVATGTLQPVRSVTVGAQVSGTINHVMVDFNSIVHTGEVVATIDPSIIKAQLESAQAVLDQAKISLTAHTATLETDQRTLTRMASLFASGLETEQDRDAARLAVDEDTAQVKEDQEDVRVEQGDVDAAALNLQYCTITSPIDGVVIERDVDEGQTVTSRMAAPSLFTIGTDLTSLTLVGDVDESDVARIRPGQPVTFTVESYPTTFRGVVTESRLNATNTSNVVTYQTVIADRKSVV